MYLIDGNNVMGQRVGWHRDKAAARQRLLRELAAFAAHNKIRLAVVFDGLPEVNIADGSSFRGVKVFYARPGSDADHRILEFVERERNRKALTVVTSDLQLLNQVRAYGVRVVRSGEFRRLLEQDFAAAEEHPPQVQDEDLSEWMRYFGVHESDDENGVP
ncbi:MAG TPA: NYN domain-containing protein [Blastocatellia bacterium]|nr:NYN domain-containing protein [Blastocatellia bacterium]